MMSATSEEADIMCSLGEGFKEEAIEALAIPEERKGRRCYLKKRLRMFACTRGSLAVVQKSDEITCFVNFRVNFGQIFLDRLQIAVLPYNL